MWIIQLQTLLVIALAFHQVQSHAALNTAQTSDALKITNFDCHYDKRFALISWETQVDIENIRNYKLEYTTNYLHNKWLLFQDKISNKKNSYTVVMKPGLSFTVRLSIIYKNSSLSEASPTGFCTTKPDIPYSQPTNVDVKAVSPNHLEVSWTPMDQLIHHGPGFHYRVYWKKANSLEKGKVVSITDWEQDKYVIQNLDAGKYEIAVRAGNNLGMCNAMPRTIYGYPGLYAPSINYFKCSENQVAISWEHLGITENIDHYAIEYNAAYAPNEWSALVESTDNTFHVFPLNVPGVTYSFRVIAKYSDLKPTQISEPTEVCVTKPDVPHKNPTIEYVKPNIAKPNQLLILWKQMPQLEHNGPNFYYVVYWRKEGSNWNEEKITNWKVNRHTIEYLPSDKYEIKVVAGNDLGESKAEPIVLNFSTQ